MKKKDNIYSEKVGSDEDVAKKGCYCNTYSKKSVSLGVQTVNSALVVFYKRKQSIRNHFLCIFVWGVFLSFFVPSILIPISYSDISYFFFVTVLIVFCVSVIPIAYCVTLWYSKRHPLVVSQEGISVKEWLRCKNYFSWEEGLYFALYQYRLPIIPTRLEIFDHHDKSRMMVPKCYDCLSIARSLEENGIPQKTKSRKWVTWRWL